MKEKAPFGLVLMLMALTSVMAVHADAADFTFTTDNTPLYYDATSYEDVYGSRYNYGQHNVVEYQHAELSYGSFSTTQIGIMEKGRFPDLQQIVGGNLNSGEYGISGGPSVVVTPSVDPNPEHVELLPNPVAFTKYSSEFCFSNGAVGYVSIPRLGISGYSLWEGETANSMNKGVAHFSSTSVWEGNVGICGHNRGARYNIGSIKDLQYGDQVIYTTPYGTRTYLVQTVTMIRNDDWSYLSGTSDNRITLITCVAGDPTHRYCVQAVEAG